MKRTAALLVCALSAGALLICGCSTATFDAYQGSEILQGKGGEMRPLDGIEFWTNGDPARKYKILGSIEEKNHEHRSAFAAEFASKSDSGAPDSEIAKIARQNGGDGVIFFSKGADADKPAKADFSIDSADDPADSLRHHQRPRFTMVVIKYVE